MGFIGRGVVISLRRSLAVRLFVIIFWNCLGSRILILRLRICSIGKCCLFMCLLGLGMFILVQIPNFVVIIFLEITFFTFLEITFFSFLEITYFNLGQWS